MEIINLCWTAQHSSALPYKLLAHCEMLFHNVFTFLLLFILPVFLSFCLFCSYRIFPFTQFNLLPTICFLQFACCFYVFYLHMHVYFWYFHLGYLFCVFFLYLFLLNYAECRCGILYLQSKYLIYIKAVNCFVQYHVSESQLYLTHVGAQCSPKVLAKN